MPAPFSTAALPACAVMGIVNVTPDSFSDGGRFLDPAAAVAHGLELAAHGAAIVDIGGESTRPGAEPVDAAEEARRVLPVVAELAARGVVVSIDTTKAAVARQAIDAGARVVNDVSAGTADPEMLAAVAAADVGFVAMHMRGTPRTMQQHTNYHDVVGEVTDHLVARVAAARDAGVRADAVLADPGIGFAKTGEQNVELLARIGELVDALAVPVVVGASRKSFIAPLTDGLDVSARDDPTLATTVWAFTRGVRVVRVHDVATTVRAAHFLHVIRRATPEGMVA
ncbi:MAG TPA: dihydropteroate synthase [Acidimicrobiia bacterium]|nr:dihydropteroate synthase [Acidimicrobiia bacterium]